MCSVLVHLFISKSCREHKVSKWTLHNGGSYSFWQCLYSINVPFFTIILWFIFFMFIASRFRVSSARILNFPTQLLCCLAVQVFVCWRDDLNHYIHRRLKFGERRRKLAKKSQNRWANTAGLFLCVRMCTFDLCIFSSMFLFRTFYGKHFGHFHSPVTWML